MSHLLLVSEQYRFCEEIYVYLFALRTKETKLRERSAWYRIQTKLTKIDVFTVKICILPIAYWSELWEAPSTLSCWDSLGYFWLPVCAGSERFL